MSTGAEAPFPPLPTQQELIALAGEPDPLAPAFTRAGRALQKHGYRPSGSAFPRVAGAPADYNVAAANIVADILDDPGSTTRARLKRRHGNWLPFVEVTSPDGRGIGYLWDPATLSFRLDGFREP